MKKPLVSVVIANYNGARFLYKCLSSVANSDYPSFEIILVDNASTDRSLDLVEKHFGDLSNLRIVENKSNNGCSQGRNVGITYSKGDYIAFLDNDTEVKKNWLYEVVKVFESDPLIGAIQCKILLANDRQKFDSCGIYLSSFGFPYEIGVGEKDEGQYDNIYEIFAARGAAVAIRKPILDRIGYFDNDYFIYGDDTDLCWRVRLNGYKVVFAPESVVFHAGAGSAKASTFYHRIFYEGSKNNIKNLIKNLGLDSLFWMLPLHIFCWFGIALVFALKGRISESKWILKGVYWHFRNLRRTLKNRYKVQHYVRKVPDSDIMSVMFGKRNIAFITRKGISWLKRIF